MQQPAFGFVIPVADQQTGGFVPGIERHAVSSIELLEIIPLAPEMFQILACLVEFENMIAGIAV